MAELDPTLAAVTDPFGAPRFYPPGQHPALRQYVEQLARLEEHREACRLAGVPATECLELIDWVGGKIAAFEEGESLAKQHHLARHAR